jgi:hypothetical protein
MKVITLIARRPDLTRAAFRAYYENNHAPLGARYFPFQKYVRNHLTGSRPETVGFDVLMECWLDRDKAMAVLDGKVAEIFAEDEARFMNAPPRPEGVDVVERVLDGPARGVDPRGLRKQAFFMANTTGIENEAFLDRVAEWGRALGADVDATRVVLDEILPGQKTPALFTADAILTLWVDDNQALSPRPPSGIQIRAALALESEETTPAELAAAFGKRR